MAEGNSVLLTRTERWTLADLAACFELNVAEMRRVLLGNGVQVNVGASGEEFVMTTKRVRRLWAQLRLPRLTQRADELRKQHAEAAAQHAASFVQRPRSEEPRRAFDPGQLLLQEQLSEVQNRLRGIRLPPPHTTPQAWIQSQVEAELGSRGMDLDTWVFLLKRWTWDRFTRSRTRPILAAINARLITACEGCQKIKMPLTVEAQAPHPADRLSVRRRAIPGASTARGGQTRKPGSRRSQR